MNPNTDRLPTTELNTPGSPQEVPEYNGLASAQNIERSPSVETVPAAPIARQPTSQLASDIGGFVPLNPQVQTDPSPGSAAASATQRVGDDDETLIDKECITKAKAIVRQTSTDPYLQTKELTKVRSDLLKRRYGKELKLSEE